SAWVLVHAAEWFLSNRQTRRSSGFVGFSVAGCRDSRGIDVHWRSSTCRSTKCHRPGWQRYVESRRTVDAERTRYGAVLCVAALPGFPESRSGHRWARLLDLADYELRLRPSVHSLAKDWSVGGV